jgi:hypothetical protein
MASLVEEGRVKEKVPWADEPEMDEVYTTLFNGVTEVPAADEPSAAWEGRTVTVVVRVVVVYMVRPHVCWAAVTVVVGVTVT